MLSGPVDQDGLWIRCSRHQTSVEREWILLSCMVKRIEIKREIHVSRIPFSYKASGVLKETQQIKNYLD